MKSAPWNRREAKCRDGAMVAGLEADDVRNSTYAPVSASEPAVAIAIEPDLRGSQSYCATTEAFKLQHATAD